jgi:predicted 3-demethylubiquinone-9 3-methyltransferase (glyoxalase superfamily)
MSNIETCLWFDGQAEEAANFYVDTFKACGRPAEMGDVSYYADNMPMPKGTVLTANFSLDGQAFFALNGGPQFTFNMAISLVIKCANQAEVDAFWDALSTGGKVIQCGWLTDRYGLAWQIVPSIILELTARGDARRTSAMFQALGKMTKLDSAALQAAYDAG